MGSPYFQGYLITQIEILTVFPGRVTDQIYSNENSRFICIYKWFYRKFFSFPIIKPITNSLISGEKCPRLYHTLHWLPGRFPDWIGYPGGISAAFSLSQKRIEVVGIENVETKWGEFSFGRLVLTCHVFQAFVVYIHVICEDRVEKWCHVARIILAWSQETLILVCDNL